MVPPRDAGVPAVPARCPTAGTAGSPGSRCPGILGAETHSGKKNRGHAQTQRRISSPNHVVSHLP